MKRYMFWITGILGLALVLAPFVLGYSDNSGALWSSIILGGVVLLVSLYEALVKDKSDWEYWLAGLAGVLAILAPFVLNFSAVGTAMWVSIILGLLIVIFSGIEVASGEPDIQ